VRKVALRNIGATIPAPGASLKAGFGEIPLADPNSRWFCSREHCSKAMQPEPMTERQKEILEYLKYAQRTTGVMPSTREIQHYFGFASQTAAMSHLRALERKGVIQRRPGKARAVVFPDELDREEIVDIPVYGQIAAGMASEVEQEREGCISIDIASIGIPRSARTFALKVRGHSMIDAHICHGDTVILEFREPRNGDIVAALIDGETTLKRYIVKNGKPFLRAENEDFPDLVPARELVIQGVLVALLRKAA
jgi:repressor LexA